MQYDFLDIGCSNGGSLAWGTKYLAGRGLGVDIDPKKVAKAVASGQDAVVGDATKLNYADNQFRCSLFFDMLEHLPDRKLAEQCIVEAFRVSREFVLIRGPNFDGEAKLRESGVKRYYTDWVGHTWHHRASDFIRIAEGIPGARWLVVAHDQIHDSGDPDLLPLSAPVDQSRYNAALHGPKPSFVLKMKMFSRLIMVLAKDPAVNMHELAILATGSVVYGPNARDNTQAQTPDPPGEDSTVVASA